MEKLKEPYTHRTWSMMDLVRDRDGSSLERSCGPVYTALSANPQRQFSGVKECSGMRFMC
jgi:hypothetical protein